MVPGNTAGAWVVAPTGTNREVTAIVQLSTATTYSYGSCVYAISQPPTGHYGTEPRKISFTGTPPFELKFESGSSVSVPAAAARTYTVPSGEIIDSFTDATRAPGVFVCTLPGAAVDFTAFAPCANALTGATWSLTDRREIGGNNETYKVRKMEDGRIWMVQGLRFGNCENPDAWYEDTSFDATTHTPTVADGHAGHCVTSSNEGSAHLYSWAGAMNNSEAYNHPKVFLNCNGMSGALWGTDNRWQGICPSGWHIPSMGGAGGETRTLYVSIQNTHNCGGTDKISECWLNYWWDPSVRPGKYYDGARREPSNLAFWTSCQNGTSKDAISIHATSNVYAYGELTYTAHHGIAVVCVKDY
jgi:uncharacterized protein (TIGR02145 family)